MTAVSVHRQRLRELAVHDEVDGSRILDLTPVPWLDPLHLVCVAATADAARADGVALTLRGLTGDRARYASRMRLRQVLDERGTGHGLTPVGERDRTGVLAEVTTLRGEADAGRVAALVHDRVAASHLELADALHRSLGETADNAPAHSGTVGFAAAQVIEADGVIRFAVADAGVGMLATLRGRGAQHSRDAIDLALAGVSGRPERGRGVGLRSVVDHVVALGGELLLASGHALVVVDGGGPRHAAAAVPVRGVALEARIPLRR